MKAHTSKVIGGFLLLFATYFVSYFASVSTGHVRIKAVVLAVPVYHPYDAAVVRAVFTPAHLVDAAFVRPARWEPET